MRIKKKKKGSHNSDLVFKDKLQRNAKPPNKSEQDSKQFL